MNTGKEKITAEEKDSQKIEIKGEEGPEKEGIETREKPLEKMKKADLILKIQELKEDSKKNYDLFLRSQADLENFKKRTGKEKADWVKYSNETLIKDILPVMDNLEKAISHSQNEDSFAALREGVELTFKGLKDALAKSGLEEVKSKGEPFDPNFHQAVSEQEDDKVEAGRVLHELQRGFTLHQRLIRPAMVVVSKGEPGVSIDCEDTLEKEN